MHVGTVLVFAADGRGGRHVWRRRVDLDLCTVSHLDVYFNARPLVRRYETAGRKSLSSCSLTSLSSSSNWAPLPPATPIQLQGRCQSQKLCELTLPAVPSCDTRGQCLPVNVPLPQMSLSPLGDHDDLHSIVQTEGDVLPPCSSSFDFQAAVLFVQRHDG